MLEIRDLHVSYGPVPILSGISFTVGDGEIVAFIGPNGAGKTTTLNAVAGLVPRRGEVLLDGEPQMLVIGRALLSEPKVLLIDELSLGLAPKMVLTLLETIQHVNAERGTA